MAKKSKKTRKVGLIGVRKSPDGRPVKRTPTSSMPPKKTKGHKSGSRHNVEEQAKSQQQSQGAGDKRLGSKKPIPLIKRECEQAAKAKPKYFSPQQELNALENDPRLQALLEQLESGTKLGYEDNQYVEQKMARHQVLCDLLGIKDEEATQAPKDKPAPSLIDQLDASYLDQFKP